MLDCTALQLTGASDGKSTLCTHPRTPTQARTPTPTQGEAPCLLERYADAKSAFLEGLVLHPVDAALRDGLTRVQALLAE